MTRDVPGRPEQRATRIAFFIAGFAVGAWAPLVPFVKARGGLADGGLGLLLLCLGAGSITVMPSSGALAMRLGCRRVLLVACGVVCLALPLLATLASLPALAIALLAFGAGVGSIDVVMNIQAIIVERASLRPMMSGFHGMFSLGGIVGAGGVSALLSVGVSPLGATLGAVGCLGIATLAARQHLLPYGAAAEGGAFAVPRGIVLLIGGLCFVMFLVEGSVLDWSAVFLATQHGASPAVAGLGYAAFALTMTLGRLGGDAVVRRLGGLRVIVLGSLCAALGLAVAVLAPAWWAGIAGYTLVGVGSSNIVPVLYTAVGRQTTMPEHAAVPATTTLGYVGILAGPAVIGFVARASSLSAALLLLTLLLIGVATSARALKAQLSPSPPPSPSA